MVESLLLAVTRVTTLNEVGATMTNATGFFYEQDGLLFLITNRHVVLSEETGHRPHSLSIELHIDPDNGFAESAENNNRASTPLTVKASTGKNAIVEVAELLPEVVEWNRQFLGAVNGLLLDDPRVRISVADVYQLISAAPAAHFDAILLDVDNGPIAMVQDGNARLYQAAGFAAITRALKPGGRVTFWSASPDQAFSKRLTQAGFTVEVISAKAYVQAKRCAHTIFAADRKRA